MPSRQEDPTDSGELVKPAQAPVAVGNSEGADRHAENLLAAHPVATLFLDRSLRLLHYSAVAGALFDLRPTDISQSLPQLSDQDHRREFNALAADAQQAIDTLAVVEREIHRSDARWFFAQISPYHSGDNAVAGVVITVADITTHKLTELSLRENNHRLSTIFAQAAVGLSEISFDGRFQRVNDQLCRMLGRSREELIAGGVAKFTHIDDIDNTFSVFNNLRDHGGRASLDKRYLRADGVTVWVNSLLTRLDDDQGQPLAILAVTVNLTVRKLAEIDLLQARETLERRVLERTVELDKTNQTLRAEIQQRKEAQKARQDLSLQLVTAQEAERGRISRELHDEVGQHITALLLGLKSLESQTADSASLVELRSLMSITQEVGHEIHTLAVELRPTALDDLGLLRALTHYVEEWSARAKTEVMFHSAGMDTGRLPRPVETTLYRIVCEALNNVSKHAAASHVSIILERRETQASVIIEDNGRGFDPDSIQMEANPHRLGLLGMKDRATLLDGSFAIESSPGRGTTVFTRIPLTTSSGTAE